MMQIIPTKPLDHQRIDWALPPAAVPMTPQMGHGQWANALRGVRVRIDLRKRLTGLFADVYMDDTLLVAGVICFDRVPLIRSAYLNFPGDLAFVDQRGTSDPTVDGLGTRFLLCYLAPGESPFDPVAAAS